MTDKKQSAIIKTKNARRGGKRQKMTYNIKTEETAILTETIDGYFCEVVEVRGQILLYIDGHFEGQLCEEENPEEYRAQILEILD